MSATSKPSLDKRDEVAAAQGRAAGGATAHGAALRRMRIGEVSARAGVSERTLRYYEEVGLLHPAAHAPGANRSYSESDVERVRRIRELQALMGFNLDEIRDVVVAEDHLEMLKDSYCASDDRSERRQALEQAVCTLDALRSRVGEKLAGMQGFCEELDGRIERHRLLLASWDHQAPDTDAPRVNAQDALEPQS